ncbi:MAG: ATP-binding protein [Bosea sp.]|uniref:ATP-binding protein n=1 Tax=Bosea sp. (in: a-proteobacteria) TaxID=1871050 RepID=UPI0023964C25|nr:ATP-binding protein [Bosea sp. (in: a-proteobacteria)]MCP4733058.1 ATP-binding protein [Bosea sp. (in: a-proteobacteria)]
MAHDFPYQIADLTKADRDAVGAFFARPGEAEFEALFRSMQFTRLLRHARFWGESVGELSKAVEELVTGMHGLHPSWAFSLTGTGTAIECRFGAERSDGRDADLQPVLSSALRNLVATGGNALSLRERHPHMRQITGAPSPPDADAPGHVLDRLCRGLVGRKWRYLVRARPQPRHDTTAWAGEFDRILTGVTRQPALQGAAALDRERDRYVALLETVRERYDDGMLYGMWEVDAWFSAPEAEVADRGAALLQSGLSGALSLPDPMRATPCLQGQATATTPLPLSSRQLAWMVTPPAQEFPGYEIVGHAAFGAQPIAIRDDGSRRSLDIGEILAEGRPSGNQLAMPLDDLTAHGLIVGVTGSGKTNTCFQILAQLAANDIPFLVVESAKSEYRELLADPRFARRPPRIFTVGNETLAPLRLNPFEVPAGTLVQSHIDYLKQLFSAAFVLYAPMPYILEQSIEETYVDRGWDLADNTNLRGGEAAGGLAFPTLDDLERKVRVVIDRMGYDSRIKMDVTAGLVARLGQLKGSGGKGPMFNTRRSHSAEELFGAPCIIELKALVSDDEKAFLIGLLLIRLAEYHEGRSHAGQDGAPADAAPGKLRHVTLIEEAHRLLRNVGMEQGGENANPKGRAIEVFTNILSEIRAYGEGILMAEQIPVKLVPDAIKNTNLKIIHRLLAKDDREAVGTTMNLDQGQIDHLARLQKGEAIVYAERLLNPVLLKVPLSPAKESAPKVREADLARAHSGAEPNGGAMLDAMQKRRPAAFHGLVQAFNAVYLRAADQPTELMAVARLYGERFVAACERCGATGAAGRVFAALLADEIESRGAYGAWRFPEMAEILRRGDELASRLDAVPSASGSRDMASQALTRFAQAVATAQRPQPPMDLPFPGCTDCRTPCAYRYDVGSLISRHPEQTEIFQSRLAEAGEPGDLVAQAQWVARGSFPEATWEMKMGAAYCYALHQLNHYRRTAKTPPAAQYLQQRAGILARALHSAREGTDTSAAAT